MLHCLRVDGLVRQAKAWLEVRLDCLQARVSERCGFFLMGELVEIDRTDELFTSPKDSRTDDYISGRFG